MYFCKYKQWSNLPCEQRPLFPIIVHTAGSNGWVELLTDKLRGKNVSTSLFQSNHNWFIQLQSRIHEISSNRVHLRIWACKQLWKFCKQKRVSSHQIFASNLSWGQILQALLNGTIWYPYETMLNMSCGGLGGGGEMWRCRKQHTAASAILGMLSIQPSILELLKEGQRYRNFVVKFPENPKIVQYPNANHSTKKSGDSRRKVKWNRNYR